jgi:hypothetical protein
LTWWFEIESNTENSIVVWGDLRVDPQGNTFVEQGDLFEIYDLHLKAGSQCIDAASKIAAVNFDKDGKLRTDDPSSPNTGDGPPWLDQGAFEYGDGADPLCGVPIDQGYENLYLFCDSAKSWQAASTYCSEVAGGDSYLTAIGSSEENSIISSFIETPSWIGATEEETEGNWVWSSSETWGEYENWVEGHPFTNITLSCAKMNTDGQELGQWEDVSCENELPFVCELTQK